MSNSKHTPGPWTLVGSGTILTSKWGRTPIAQVDLVGAVEGWNTIAVSREHEEETRANARLIAAAPELLDALEKFVACDNYMLPASVSVAYETAKAAIAKARGEK